MNATGIIILVVLLGGFSYLAYKFIQKKKDNGGTNVGPDWNEGDGGQEPPVK